MMSGNGDEPEYVAAVEKIMKAAKDHGDLPVLTFAPNVAEVEQRRKQGFRLLMIGADGFTLAAGMRDILNQAHDKVVEVDGKAPPGA